jgi:hypothetical protein
MAPSPRSISRTPATGRPGALTRRRGRLYSGRWMLTARAHLGARCQDIQGGHSARVVTQMSASRQCKRAVERGCTAGVPARGGRPPHRLVQHAPGPARGRRDRYRAHPTKTPSKVCARRGLA